MATRKSGGKKAGAKLDAGQPLEEPSPAPAAPADNMKQLGEVRVVVSMDLGRAHITLEEALSLDEHSLLELDRTVGDPIHLLVNGRLFARGEVVTVGENFGVRITEIVGEI